MKRDMPLLRIREGKGKQMKVYVLVKDYGYEGLRIYGATANIREATFWKIGEDNNDFVEADLSDDPNGSSLETSRRKLEKTTPPIRP